MKKAKIKALEILMFAPTVFTVAYVVFTIVAPGFVPGMEASAGKGSWVVIGICTLVSIGTIKALATPIRLMRESEEYDEFGVRKKSRRKSKFDLDSADRKRLEAEALARLEAIIPRDTIRNATHEGPKNPVADLEKMVGMEPVKDVVRGIMAKLEFESKEKRPLREGESRHAVLFGAPGTGKTTVARILAALYYEYGVTSENKCVEFDGNTLKSYSPGETAIKIKAAVRAAYGGVLFIDEAYSLTNARDAEGAQAVAVLIKEMEDNRDKFVLILAGYTNEMTAMLNSNPGFRSRIKHFVNFPDYTDDELVEIAVRMADERDFSFTQDAVPVFRQRMEAERRLDSWGNARTVRNVVEECVDAHAVNYVQNKLPKAFRYIILPEDISPYPAQSI